MSIGVSRNKVSNKGGIHLLNAVLHRLVWCVLEPWHQESVGKYLDFEAWEGCDCWEVANTKNSQALFREFETGAPNLIQACQ
jgi:hypothetical protein